MKIGYARISTEDQNINLQIDALKIAGCEIICQDVSSGSKAQRPGLDEVFKYAREGDTVIVWKLDRLGRSIKHLIQTVGSFQDKKVYFKSLQENIDTETSTGKLIFHIFGALAEFERDIIRERTKAGLKSARARGRLGGRPFLLDKRQVKRMIEIYNDQKMTVKEICKIYNIKPMSVYNYLKRDKIGKKNERSE